MMTGSVSRVNPKGSKGRLLIPGAMTVARKPGEVRKMTTQGVAEGAGSGRNLGEPKLNTTAAVIVATIEPKLKNGISHQGLGGRAELTQPAKLATVRWKESSRPGPMDVPAPAAMIREGL